MITTALIGIVVLCVTAASVWLVMRITHRSRTHLPRRLLERRRELRATLSDILRRMPKGPPLSATDVPSHPSAASIEAKLLAGTVESALREAESLRQHAPHDPRARLLLARVLIHREDADAAMNELTRARRLGASGSLLDYLDARVSQLKLSRRVAAMDKATQSSPIPALITPFEMLILQLERQRSRSQRAAVTWLAENAKVELTDERLVALITDHFTAYYDCLTKLTVALKREPAFVDALYHAARLALKVGFIDQGMTLMTKLEPLMVASTEKQAYERDMAQLRDTVKPARDMVIPPFLAGPTRHSAEVNLLN